MSKSEILIISPHSDDVLFSLYTFIKNLNKAKVITVCGGIPDSKLEISNWDKKCGFTSAFHAGYIRNLEDQYVFDKLGINLIQLPFLDLPYENNKNIYYLEEMIEANIVTNSEIWAPMGIGNHPDHILSRNAVLNIYTKKRYMINLKIYEDAPYSNFNEKIIRNGKKKEEFAKEKQINELKEYGFKLLSPIKRVLIREEMLEKLKLVSYYKSQIEPLKYYYPAIDSVEGELSIETLWECQPLNNGYYDK